MEMTENRRIALNIVATYGRSLYALVIGLFCGRWMLMALGQTDYGLYGVVGGLTAFISFFNGIMSGAVGRFYAVSVGAQKLHGDSGLEECRAWFTTAVIIHTVLPIVLMLIGYPVGEWAVRNFLTIPLERIESCVWVWRFVCITCFLGMFSVPYNAMYGAHQYIAELTIYSFITTTLNALFLYYMITHPGVWLTRYALAQLILGLLPNVIITIRACFLFPECRFGWKYIHCWPRIRGLCNYGFWNAWGVLGAMLRGQGIAILVNKYFGATANAGIAVGTNLSGQCNSLAGSMLGAFSPAIFNAWGAHDYTRARMMAFQTCKIGTILILIFSLPLSLEVEHVLKLWLVNPPPYAVGICLCVMAMTVIDKMAVGQMICVNANGKVARYQAFLGTSLVCTLPIAWILMLIGCGVYSVGYAMVATMCVCASGRVWFARKLVGMSARYWFSHVFLPIAGIALTAGACGLVPRFWFEPSFGRICLTTVLVECVLLPLTWLLLLTQEEKEFVMQRIRRFVKR